MTSGISPLPAWLTPSCMSARPGPEVPVMERTPVSAAPIAMLMAASSSSAWRAMPPNCGSHFCSQSRMSVAGVMG